VSYRIYCVNVKLSVQCADPFSGFEQLASWLSQEPELRGRVQPEVTTPAAGELPSAEETLPRCALSADA
jgi:hypothetical protein